MKNKTEIFKFSGADIGTLILDTDLKIILFYRRSQNKQA